MGQDQLGRDELQHGSELLPRTTEASDARVPQAVGLAAAEEPLAVEGSASSLLSLLLPAPSRPTRPLLYTC